MALQGARHMAACRRARAHLHAPGGLKWAGPAQLPTQATPQAPPHTPPPTLAPSMVGFLPGATSLARALSACSTAPAIMPASRWLRAVPSTMKSVKGQRPRTSMMAMSSARASAWQPGGGGAVSACVQGAP